LKNTESVDIGARRSVGGLTQRRHRTTTAAYPGGGWRPRFGDPPSAQREATSRTRFLRAQEQLKDLQSTIEWARGRQGAGGEHDVRREPEDLTRSRRPRYASVITISPLPQGAG